MVFNVKEKQITDFKVVCDSSNNTGQVIDTNNFIGDIYINIILIITNLL